MRIGIDIMGGDNAPNATVSGVILAKKEISPKAQIVLIGNKPIIEQTLEEKGEKVNEYEIIHTLDDISMCDQPTKAFLQKPNSSIAIGLKLLQENNIQGFASAGNTGAMLVGSIYTVKSIEGIIRPSIMSIIPKLNGTTGILMDVGANVDCKPDVLNQFGILGSLYAEHILKIENPSVGLLNIGEEKEKGNLVAQAAYELMSKNTAINFIGNIEGRDILTDNTNVIVCDGFVGNIVLKQLESMYAILRKKGMLDEYFNRFNYENQGGTPVLGVNSAVIIGHGISNDIAIKNMILLTNEVAESNISEKIKRAFNGKN